MIGSGVPSYSRDSFIQAAIFAGYTFFMVLASFTLTGIRADPLLTVGAAAIASGGTFFAFLAGKMLPGPPKLAPPP
jgi:hypothetical protein